ncbi:MAG: hypothetical protein WBU92_06050 [Candidatus Dormiibacterota bacterium]
MNYQDFESAWYLGLMITSFFAIMLVGLAMALRRVRRLFVTGDVMSGWLTLGASLYTFVFLLALCLAMLILLVVQGSG